MKKTLLFPLFLLCLLTAFAQTATYHFAEEFYFVKEIAVSTHKDKQFRYEIAVRSRPEDTLSKVRIHGIAAGKRKDDFIKSNFIQESRIEQEWVIYTIAGRVEDGTHKLLFYASVNGNGDFYFDDVSFYIEATPGKWKQLELFNPSFEISEPDIFAGYYVSNRRSPGVTARLSEAVYKTGHLSLNVRTSGNDPLSGKLQQVVSRTPRTEEELNDHLELVEVAPYLMIPRIKKESQNQGSLLSKSKTK